MSVVELEDGAGSGRTVRITDGGAARTEPAPCTTTSAQVTVSTSSTVVANARAGRRQITIQNSHTSAPIHLALDDAPATTSHFTLPAGAIFEFPPGVTYEGAIEAISSSGNIDVVVIEYHAGDVP